MKSIIVYHQAKKGTDCPDGIAAAWVTARYLRSHLTLPEKLCSLFGRKSFELIGEVYLNNKDYEKPDYKLPFDPTGRHVYIDDFSYPEKVLRAIADVALSLTVLDHHESRMNDIAALRDRILGGFSKDECGTSFAWKHFFPDEPVPWFVKHIRMRDIGANGYYQGLQPDSEKINAAISARRKGKQGEEAFKVFDDLMKLSEDVLREEGKPLIEERDRTIEQALSQYNGALICVGEYIVPLYQLTDKKAHPYYSTIGNQAAIKHANFPFVAIVTDDPLSISLRGAEHCPVHLGELARSLGGGGHAKAAGYTLKDVQLPQLAIAKIQEEPAPSLSN